ncbi:trypsin-like peptidase domain-containing protein [Streptomyces europaeiscabiei]|uniref:trypsin-like peptidase domain-containing protein n=1 Tax=Streptomyces europaeiscabiei TaxID=146819 RepID=UPI0029A19CE2|nr:trypsin-like peptidase domain-containing protein [Streptomyces europaeiscabiei]MDX3618670.1 trypsin-like peptidase domain-containing protein [Streptomyces europaeiscabiei]MDX3629600.1 trypsin-like peptidase domain-containing protein [Streptomyces europaeiscabiei]MDX3648217.1 trypsin-like peptidase domain-containing protein [Streptomyces europaeiscabiei]
MTANADRGLRPERVAEIIVALSDGGAGRRGSGYLVSPGKVLTAAHVVAGATTIRVRFQADRPGERTVEASVAWRHEGIDIAVLALPDDDTELIPVPYGRVGEHDAVLRCTALGFPRFKLRTGDDGSRFRDAEHVHATCAVLSNRREGTLDLCVTSPPADDPDPERDAWEGMSGAALFAGDRLVGVITRHHRSDGPGRVAASRADRWAEKLSATELASLEETLGCELCPGTLPDALPATGLALIQEIYRAQLADIAPEELTDRQSELRDLVEFCGGPTQYRWLQGPPWTGKTALAAWFALHPPRGVVPVWFFITARYAGQSDGDAYTGAVIEQLATIAGREPNRHASPTARDGERRLLLREAAERVAQNGGTLLLVVDGLDEDQSLQPGGSGTSIAALLPQRLPSNVRVLVTSRPSPDIPGIPSDVKGSHPLRGCPVVKLSTVEAARHTEHEAKYDLHRAFTGERLERDLLGLLTAARGTLTDDDLRALTGEPGYTLRHRLGSVFGRILRLRGSDFNSAGGGDTALYTTSRGYLFAHETLLKTAENELGPDVDAYRERVHVWAETYERRGWPEDTPPYLLQPYGRLVALLRDVSRTTALATDARRRDRLREVTGSDAACLAEIAAARETVRRVAPEDLGMSVALAVVGDLVARRNESLHPDIPAVYARLGRPRLAIGLARSVFRPMDRARALGRVARVLADEGDLRAVGVAEEALRLTEETIAERPGFYSDTCVLEARGRLAIALAAVGLRDEALRRLSELPVPEYDSDVEAMVEAFVSTATALQAPRDAAGLLRRAEKAVENMWRVPARMRAMASIAEAWAACGDLGSAVRLYDSVVMLAHYDAEDSVEVAATVADVLREVRPREAERIARRAAEYAQNLLRSLEGPEIWGNEDNWYRLTEAVRALVVADQLDDGWLLARAVRQATSLELREELAAIAEGLARRGRAAEAWAALAGLWKVAAHRGENASSTAVTAGLLVRAGAADQLETLLLNESEVPQWHVSEALAVLAAHFAEHDPQRSWRLLDRAAPGHQSEGGEIRLSQPDRFAAFAGALATVSLSSEAERLIRALGSRDAQAWGYAAAAVAVAPADRSRALRFAEEAIHAALTTPVAMVRADTLTTALEALAHAGATDRVMEMIEHRLGGMRDQLVGYDHDMVCMTASSGLWPHDPEAAARLVDDLLPGTRSGTPSLLAMLLAVVRPHDGVRSGRILRALQHMASDDSVGRTFHDEVLMSLFTAVEDPAAARRRFDQALLKNRESWPSRPGTAEAIVYAVLGDHEAAQAVARGRATGEERGETLADLAAYVACVPGVRKSTSFENSSTYIPAICRFAAMVLPPLGGPDLRRARALLAEAATPDGWHHVVPVLAAIDPDAVHRVWDVVFAHVGLSD